MKLSEFYKDFRKKEDINSFLKLLQGCEDDIELIRSFVSAIDLRVDELNNLSNDRADMRATQLKTIAAVLKKRLDLEVFS